MIAAIFIMTASIDTATATVSNRKGIAVKRRPIPEGIGLLPFSGLAKESSGYTSREIRAGDYRRRAMAQVSSSIFRMVAAFVVSE
jgi:hypothetical protein